MIDPLDEMLAGYKDGLDLGCPEPSSNRTLSYCHGFANGRADMLHQPRASAAWLRQKAEAIIAAEKEIGV